MSDTLTDAQIKEGLRLAGEYSRSLAVQSKYLAHFNSHYAAALREVQALRVRIADLELVIASANNSLHGSEGTFLNLNGSDVPDKFHLSGPIEDLKRDAKQVQALREQVQAATDQCDHILRLYSSPLVGENEAECVKRRAIYSIVEKIRGKVSR